MTRDPMVDAYIEKAEAFAKPILRHIRDVVHEAAPEIEEAIKWGFPNFVREGIVCHMASFKAHCSFGFWKAELLIPDAARREEAMGQFGRITSVDDLPAREELTRLAREAVRLNESGAKAPARKREREELAEPEPFRQALDRSPETRSAFDAMPPSHRREYIQWIAEAKREATRDRRIATALEWIGEGKPRNWKYMKGAG
jgi:uncharacterized protein YdeI (YjbR/CyaY-like superfamily)